MRTCIAVIDPDGTTSFLSKDGDYSHLDGIVVDGDHTPGSLEEQAYNLLENTPVKDYKRNPSKDWTYYITLECV